MMKKLSQKLLHDLETHYHNITTLYNDGLDLETIREKLNIFYDDWLPMEDIIFDIEPIYKCNNIFNNTLYYKYNHNKGKSQEIT